MNCTDIFLNNIKQVFIKEIQERVLEKQSYRCADYIGVTLASFNKLRDKIHRYFEVRSPELGNVTAIG